jgi:hypothetical protein
LGAENMIAQLAQQGWVADYPPWFWKFWIKPARCRSEEESSQLLHLLRSIEDGKPEETRRLLPGIDPNVRLAVQGKQSESLLEWAAEKARHPDCIRVLVAAGANLKAPKLVTKLVCAGKTQLLREMIQAGADTKTGKDAVIAACWDDPKALRLLLEAGVSANATTTVYITNRKRVSKVTPLMVAAYAGQLEAVKLLLQAGVDVGAVDSDGNTVTAWAKISGAKGEAGKIILLLERAGATAVTDTGTLPEPVDFSSRAKTPKFKEALAVAKAITKSAGKTVELAVGPLLGAYAFRVRDAERTMAVLDEVRSKVASLGVFAFLSEDLHKKSGPCLVLVPAADYREAIIAFETPAGQSMDSYELAAWLADLEKTQPFVITHIAPDRIQARFTTPIRDAKRLAKAIRSICPDVINESLDKVARYLERSRELYLWWD